MSAIKDFLASERADFISLRDLLKAIAECDGCSLTEAAQFFSRAIASVDDYLWRLYRPAIGVVSAPDVRVRIARAALACTTDGGDVYSCGQRDAESAPDELGFQKRQIYPLLEQYGVVLAAGSTPCDATGATVPELQRQVREQRDALRRADYNYATVLKTMTEMQAEIDRLAYSYTPPPAVNRPVAQEPADKNLDPRERTSLHSMVISMAIGGYGYDPNEQKSRTPGEILADTQKQGVALGIDTIRKHLGIAAQLLPTKSSPQTE